MGVFQPPPHPTCLFLTRPFPRPELDPTLGARAVQGALDVLHGAHPAQRLGKEKGGAGGSRGGRRVAKAGAVAAASPVVAAQIFLVGVEVAAMADDLPAPAATPLYTLVEIFRRSHLQKK